MAEQFWIGGFYIDLSRNQIRQNGQTQTLAPKALAVLTHLAENQGNVVSQEELLDTVWQGTVVSPNTLQRSIAQLRKALGDDGKVQVYIKTHAKKGYSLECDVHWQLEEKPNEAKESDAIENAGKTEQEPVSKVTEPVLQSDNSKKSEKDTSNINGQEIAETGNRAVPFFNTTNKTWPLVIFTILISIIVVSYVLVNANKQSEFSISEFRALTATDKKEFGGAYSPLGRYVVFSRYENLLCQNNIWAKDLETQQEYQLTQNAGAYSGHTFSQDGNTLVFIKEQDCTKPLTQKKCFTLMSLDFNASLKAPAALIELMECKNSAIKKPKWLNNNKVALLQKLSKRWRLISYSLETNSSQVLFETPKGNILDYAYSSKDNLIAVTSVNENDEYLLNMLSTDGELLSSHQIELPKEIAKYRYIRPNFTGKEYLIFSTGRQLFSLSFSGEVSNISMPTDRPMGTPVFHPSGKRMMVVTGHYDADIISMPFSQYNQPTDLPVTRTLARSTTGEYNAMLQPHGQLIAFKSKRSGEEQVWLTGHSGTRQLTQFPMDSYIVGMDWSNDGKNLLVNVNHQLVKVSLDGKVENLVLPNSIEKLFHWDSKANKALAMLRINGISEFAEIDLNSLQFRILNNKSVSWAAKIADGRLVYSDSLDRFWIQGPVEDELIEELSEQGSSLGAVLKDDVIYGANRANQLWSYHLKTAEFKVVGSLPENLDHLTDITEEQIYGVIRVSAKKELAELFIKE